MTGNQDTLVVFTARSPERVIREGGSQSWVLNPVNARQCRWLVCTQNRHNPDYEFSDATEPHGSAFLLGRIDTVMRSREEGAGDRWLIALKEYARIEIADLWDHGRNPVRYASLRQLGIDPEKYEFQPMPQKLEIRSHSGQLSVATSSTILTIAEAKKELAARFGVRPEAVEITIRG